MDWKSDLAADERRRLEAVERKQRDIVLDEQETSRADREKQNLKVNRGLAIFAALAAAAALIPGLRITPESQGRTNQLRDYAPRRR
jgi:hypothetical protein